jgi:hypothetical protein
LAGAVGARQQVAGHRRINSEAGWIKRHSRNEIGQRCTQRLPAFLEYFNSENAQIFRI